METTTKPAIKSITIRVNAIILGIIAVLQIFNIDIPETLYPAVIAAIPFANIILRFVTKKPITLIAQNSDVGRILTPCVVYLCLFSCIAGSTTTFLLNGCAGINRSATAQLSTQTDDAGIIALGTYADAQDLYINAQKLYLPYQTILQRNNPDLDIKIIGLFRQANKMLNDWEIIGYASIDDKQKFRDYIRDITMQLSQTMKQ